MTGSGPDRRTPLCAESRLVRTAGLHYTEVDGHPLVITGDGRAFTELAPGALALWAALDGRPLAQVTAQVDPAGERRPVEHLDAVRRLRALGLVEEAAVVGPVEPVDQPPPKELVALRGRVADQGATLVIDPTNPDTDDQVTVFVDPPTVVGAPVPLTTVVGAGAPGPPLDARQRFGLLLGGLADHEVGAPGVADALAGLAEALVGPDPTP